MYRLDLAAAVDPGLVREANQDVARVLPNLRLAMVADGMGGHQSGEVASRAAADALWLSLERQGIFGADLDETRQRLIVAFHEANVQVGRHPSAGGRTGMGTTLVASIFTQSHVVIAHVGDSRCYRLRGRELELLTEDHSLLMDLRRQGAYGAAEARSIEEQLGHVLTRCINGCADLIVDARVESCEPGDVFLLCSDGLWGCVAPEALVRTLAEALDAAEACARLIQSGYAGGGTDNIGVAVARIEPLTGALNAD